MERLKIPVCKALAVLLTLLVMIGFDLPMFSLAEASSARFTGSEEVRLGKKSPNIGAVIMKSDGSLSTSIARHWVTVDGVKYTAFCIEAAKSSTSGQDGRLEQRTDAGLLWILTHVSDDTDEAYAIKQQAVWAYLGQSFSISELAAGENCSLSTEELRQQLTDIVQQAQNASASGNQELWIAYHVNNRNEYQDMAFAVDALPRATPEPTEAPTPEPTATPEPTEAPTPEPTATPEPTEAPTPEPTATPEPTEAPIPEPTATPEPTEVPTPEPTATPEPTEVPTPEPTATPEPTEAPTPKPTATPEPATGRIRLIKTDSLDGTPIADVQFDIYDTSGNEVASMTTDEEGVAISPALMPGRYTVCEYNTPDGYVCQVIQLRADVQAHEATDLSVENKPIQGKIRIEKRDALTGERLTGAEFTVTRISGLPSHNGAGDGEVVARLTTDADGVAETSMLTYGVYRVAETKVPANYVDSAFFCEVTIIEEDMGTYLVECDNMPIQGRILLDKKGLQLTDVQTVTDVWGNEVHMPVYAECSLADAVFEVWAAEEIIGPDGTVWYHAGELVDTITTTASGSDTSRMLPLGKYEVVEISAPAGYICNSEPIFVELLATDSATPVVEVRITAQNDYLPAEITLFKEKEIIQTAVSGKDVIHSVPTTAPGEDCVFGLFTAQNFPYAGGTLVADTLVATGATDANGMLIFSGRYPHGEYNIRELYAPEGWKIIAEQLPITLSPEQSEENVISVLLTEPICNELIHTEVTLTKTDITGEKTLPGAVIEVYNEAGNLIYRDMTDEHGEIASIPVMPGNYTFREVYAPSGYALNEAIMHFTVSEDGSITGDTAIQDDFSRFSIEKVDESGHPLSGVVFCLVNADNIVLQTAATDRNGLATFEQVPFGSYRIVETVALAGYEPAEIQVEVTIDGTFVNPEKPIATIVNVPNEVLVQKVDADGRPLAGATFGLFDIMGEQFAVAASDENGLVRFTKIPCGSYTLCELSVPDGYLLSKEEIAFTIDADYRSTGQPVATVTNQRKQVRFIKVDTSGKFLPGVEFALINAVTHEVAETAVSNEQGEFVFTRFDYGDWIIRETAAPEGYSRMEDYLLHVDENWTEPEPIRLINIPCTYLFYKCDNRKNPLAGVVFAVEDEHGHVVQEVTSAENGVVTIEGLTPGKYTIREITTVEGFAVSGDTITVVIDENYTVPTKLKRFVNYPNIATGVDVSPTMLTWVGVGLVGAAGVVILVSSTIRKNHPAHRHK